MTRPKRQGRLGLAFLAAVATGCAEELGPERFPTTLVTGYVHVGKEPLPGGWIEFYPVDGTVGLLRSAPIRPDGTFEADRVPVGRNSVGVVGPRGPFARRLRTFETLGTPIQRSIPPGPSSTLDLDLVTELLRSRKPAPKPR